MSSDNHNNKNTIAIGAFISLVGRGVSTIFSFLFRRYLIIFFGLEITGLIFFAHKIISLVAILTNFGISFGIQKFVAIAYGKKEFGKVKGAIISSLQIIIPLSIFITVLLYFFAPEVSDFFTKFPGKEKFAKELPVILRIFSLCLLPTVVLGVLLAILRATNRIFPTFIIDNVFNPISWLLFVIIIGNVGFENKTIYLIIALCCLAYLAVILSLLFFKRIWPNLKNATTVYCRKKIITFSLPLFFKSFAQIFLQLDILMIGYFCSFEMVAIYGAASAFARQSALIMTAFSSLFYPMIADLYNKGNSVALHDLYKTVTRWCLIFALPLIAIVMVIPASFMDFLRITNSPEAYTTIRIIASAQIISVLVGFTGGMLIMTNHPWFTFINNCGSVILNIVLNLILIPRYGIVGAAIATASAVLIRNIAALLEIKKILSFSPFSFSLLKVIGSCCLAIISVLLFKKYFDVSEMKYWIVIMICSAIFVSVYLPLILIFLEKEDKEFITKTFKSLILKIR